jgi:hypothetical protein
MANKTEQIGFFVTPEVKAKLQKLAIEHNRTMSGQLTEMIVSEFKKMQDEQSNALSK